MTLHRKRHLFPALSKLYIAMRKKRNLLKVPERKRHLTWKAMDMSLTVDEHPVSMAHKTVREQTEDHGRAE